MTKLNKTATNYSTTWDSENGKGSLLSTINPLSQVMMGVDYVPGWLMKATPFSPTATHLAFKSALLAAAAAAAVGGSRYLLHREKMDELKKRDNPGSQLKGNLGTTFEFPIAELAEEDPSGKQAAPPKPQPKTAGMAGNVFATVVPSAIALAAAAISYQQVDKWAEDRKARILTNAVEGKSKALQNLVALRARIPQGLVTPQEYDSTMGSLKGSDLYIKEGSAKKAAADSNEGALNSFNRLGNAGLAIFGLLGAAALLGTGYGAYTYFSAANPANIRYRALKAGLDEYAKQKAAMTPITMMPVDTDKIVKKLDGTPDQTLPRDLPEYNTNSIRQPVAI